MQYTLKEISVIWHLYGGRDFGPSPPERRPSPGSSPLSMRRGSKDSTPGFPSPQPVRTRASSSASSVYSSGASPMGGRKYSSSPSLGVVNGSNFKLMKGKKMPGGGRGRSSIEWKAAGGPGRDHSILMEIELDKVCGCLGRKSEYSLSQWG